MELDDADWNVSAPPHAPSKKKKQVKIDEFSLDENFFFFESRPFVVVPLDRSTCHRSNDH